jgi:hypothetical protein
MGVGGGHDRKPREEVGRKKEVGADRYEIKTQINER